MAVRKRQKINYLQNIELLYEINKSKKQYSYFIDDKYSDFSVIVKDINNITDEEIEKGKIKKADDYNHDMMRQAIHAGKSKKEIDKMMEENEFKPEHFTIEDLTFRQMTYDHVPQEVIDEGQKTLLNRIKFPPFKHYAFIDGELKEVGRSHWLGGLDNGYFSYDHGTVSKTLSEALMKMVDRYGSKSNFCGYCVDEATEALTQRGWLTYDQIEIGKDKILSLDTNTGNLAWSNISDMYVGKFNDNMFKLTGSTVDALVTPGHKFLDKNKNLKPIEYFNKKDYIVTMGEHVLDTIEPTHSDAFVELVGWYITEGSLDTYNRKRDGGISYYARIYQSKSVNSDKCDRIVECISELTDANATYGCSDTERLENGAWEIRVPHYISSKLVEVAPNKVLTTDFILSLTQHQRDLLINTMMDGDGSGTQYVQKDKAHVDSFLMLCTLAGITTNTSKVETTSGFGPFSGYVVTLSRKKQSKVECINMYGAKRKQTGGGGNWGALQPTTPYNGMVWCPSTDYGNFVCRRGKKIYVTGNSYLDDMKGQALLQLSTVSIQFNEEKSDNPFAYFTTTIHTSFLKILKFEKKQRQIRDEILQQEAGMQSFQHTDDDHD